jgi:hypothetical protein
MSLYWPDNEGQVVKARKLHALVIGVGVYDHLGLGVAKPATVVSGLAPLSTTPLSAARIARWLESEYINPACPLGSIELLLSDPAPALPRADGKTVDIERATMQNITDAFGRWYDRCKADHDNIAFFYFAGHGLSAVIGQFLLPGDFGNPDLPDDWANCIDFNGLQIGMRKCVAQTQLFFVDACRDYNMNALLQTNPHGKALVSSSVQDQVLVSAAYLAASAGRHAYGKAGEETFFCKALIACLNGVAARKPGLEWRVDSASLSSALPAAMAAMAAAENLPLDCECRVQRPAPIHFPNSGAVLVQVNCSPDAVKPESTITVTQGATTLTSPAGESRPWLGKIVAGSATVEVRFSHFPPEVRQIQAAPPTYEVEVAR